MLLAIAIAVFPNFERQKKVNHLSDSSSSFNITPRLGVSRGNVLEGAKALGIALEKHIENVTKAMQGISFKSGF